MIRVAVVALAIALTACSGGLESVRGTIVEVDGDLASVSSFTIRSTGSETLTFVPVEGLLFQNGPLSHLTDHLRSGEQVDVTYEVEGETLVAVRVSDGG